MYGEQGTGKGWFFKKIADRVYGPHSPLYRQVNNADHVFGHFTMDGVDRTLMMLFDETEVTEDRHMGSLKSQTTDDRQNANYKYKAHAQTEIWWQGYLATNKNYPIKVEGNDRRCFVLKSKVVTKHLADIVIELKMDPSPFDYWLGWVLSNYPEVTENWHAQNDRPQTYSFHDMKVQSMSWVSAWWLGCLKRQHHCLEPKDGADRNDNRWFRQHHKSPVWQKSPYYNTKDSPHYNPRLPEREIQFHDWQEFVSLEYLHSVFCHEAKPNPRPRINTFQAEFLPLIYPHYSNADSAAFSNRGLISIPPLQTCVSLFCGHHHIDPRFIDSQLFRDVKLSLENDLEDGETAWDRMKKRTQPPPPVGIFSQEEIMDPDLIDIGSQLGDSQEDAEDIQSSQPLKRICVEGTPLPTEPQAVLKPPETDINDDILLFDE